MTDRTEPKSIRAEILTIGDEVIRGEIVDSNKARLAQQLLRCNIDVRYQTSVADDKAVMSELFETAAARSDLVLITGGLGPTSDDLTTEVIADTFGCPLFLHEPTLETIRLFFQKRTGSQRPMPESNAKQAYFPEGAAILANPMGTAPGFRLSVLRSSTAQDEDRQPNDRQEVFLFCMPGVPRELDCMMNEQVMPWIERQWPNRPVTRERRLRTFGIGESALEDALNKVDLLTRIEQDSQLRFGYRTAFPDNFLRIIAQAPGAAQAEEKLDEVSAWIREAIGPKVYAEGETTLEEVLSGQLRVQGKTLALAESCTGGLVAQLLTNLPGSSEIFKGGVVAYANAAKTDLLGVSSELLAEHGAVSEPVAAAMAQGARKRFGTDFGLASTGISGPDGGTPEKPVGTVYLAWAWEGETRVEHFQLEFKRDMHRRLCAQILFDGLRRHLMGLDVVSSNSTGRKLKATENR